MPRIRVRKDWDWEPNEDDFPEIFSSPQSEDPTGDQSTDAANSTAHGFDPGWSSNPPRYEGYSADSGESWLSNAVIIGSLPDDKLKAALARYKSIVRLCEAEITARALAPKRPTRSRHQHVDLAGADTYRCASPRQRRSKTQSSQFVMTPEQLTQALMMLIKLKEKKT